MLTNNNSGSHAKIEPIKIDSKYLTLTKFSLFIKPIRHCKYKMAVTPLSLHLSITHRLNTIDLLPLQSCTEVVGQNLTSNSYIIGHTWYWHDCRVRRDENKQCKKHCKIKFPFYKYYQNLSLLGNWFLKKKKKEKK